MAHHIRELVNQVRERLTPGITVVEVGVWDGATSGEWVPIVTGAGGWAVLVDNFMGNPSASGGQVYTGEKHIGVKRELLTKVEGNSRVVLVDSDSADAATLFQDSSVDICFLDADHRYEFTARDIKAWLPKVKPGGLLGGHDCDGSDYDERFIDVDMHGGKHHGVIKAVNELKIAGYAVSGAGSCWWTVKQALTACQ